MPDAIESLWAETATGSSTLTSEQERHPDGNYSHRHYHETWTKERNGYTVIAVRSQLTSFNLSSDREMSQRTLTIKRADGIVCAAIQKGPGHTTKFAGADERFLGHEVLPVEDWKVVSGALPQFSLSPPC